jgi:hypothetical protein
MTVSFQPGGVSYVPGGGGPVPGLNTEVFFNDFGTTGTNSNFTYDKATNTVTFGNITGSALNMVIQPKAPSITEIPGTLVITGRSTTRANTAGGAVQISTGANNGVASSGALSLGTANATANGNSGNLTISTGTAPATGVSGNITIQPGDALGKGGSVLLRGGKTSANGDSGGDITFLGGDGVGTGSIGGSCFFFGGNAPGLSGFGGSMQFQTGYGDSGTGTVQMLSAIGATCIFEAGDDGISETRIRFFGLGNGTDLVVQQDTATASATRAAVTGTVANVGDTYDGYTLAQVVKALRNYGLLT